MEKRVIFLGLPGSGKGTQGNLLADSLCVPHLSIGDIVRDLVRAKSPLAQEIRSSWIGSQKWQPLQDDLSVRVAQAATTGLLSFVLDGFPRNVVQAKHSKFLEPINFVVVLAIPEEESVKRVLNRMRQDDSEEKVRQRLAVEQTRFVPLLDYCREHYQLIEVDGTQSVETLHRQIHRSIG